MSWFDRKSKLPDGIKRELKPSRQFTEKTKERFLASFDVHQSSRPAGAEFLSENRAPWAVAWKTAGVALAAIGVVAATSAYADVQNVSPTSPLYPLKRLAESAQLAFASSGEKPALELSFAARRADEIRVLASADVQSSSTRNSGIIAGLANDMERDASGSLATAAVQPATSTVTVSAQGSASGSISAAVLSPVNPSLHSFCDAAEGIKIQLGIIHPDFAARVFSACGFNGSSTASTTITGRGEGDGGGDGGAGAHDGTIIHRMATTTPWEAATSTGTSTDRHAEDHDGGADVNVSSSAAVSVPSVTTPPVTVTVPAAGVSVTVPSLSL